MKERESIIANLDKLGDDELAIVEMIVSRLANLGRAGYGEFRVATDTRDMHEQALEECADGLFYVHAGLLKSRRARYLRENPDHKQAAE